MNKLKVFLNRLSSLLLRLPLIGGFLKLFTNNNIRGRILFTIGVLILYRLLANVPPPGIDVGAFAEVFKDNPLTSIFTLATGGNLDNPSLVMIGLGAYINASVIIQLLTVVVPKLEALSKEGEVGRQIMNQYTRFLTVPLSILQAIVFYVILSRSSTLVSGQADLEAVVFVSIVAAGTFVMMWLAELITQKGLGNGTSVLITFSIIASLPSLIQVDLQGVMPVLSSFWGGTLTFVEMITAPAFMLIYGVVIGLILLIVLIVYIGEAVRKVTIQYARRATVGTNYLPIRINQAGVMPVIFASSILTFPGIIAQFMTNAFEDGSQADSIVNAINNSFLNNYSSLEYNLLYFALIIGFTFFYTFVIMKPSETADNLKKSGGFIPGIRPGKSTEKYLIAIMLRLTTIGAVFLAIVTIIPTLSRIIAGSNATQIGILSGIGGTSLLIVVNVLLTTYRQIRSIEATKSYDKYR